MEQKLEIHCRLVAFYLRLFCFLQGIQAPLRNVGCVPVEDLGLQSHAALRAATRPLLTHFGVHGACVPGVLLAALMRGSRRGLQVLGRIGIELLLAALAAEVVGFAFKGRAPSASADSTAIPQTGSTAKPLTVI